MGLLIRSVISLFSAVLCDEDDIILLSMDTVSLVEPFLYVLGLYMKYSNSTSVVIVFQRLILF